jgi:hypothetical protein
VEASATLPALAAPGIRRQLRQVSAPPWPLPSVTAGGIIGTHIVANAPGDGYTLLFPSAPFAIADPVRSRHTCNGMRTGRTAMSRHT